MNISRRGFLLGGAAAVGAGGCGLFGVQRPRSYSVSILGDIHFDSTDRARYHSRYTHSTTRERYENHLKEHVRNAAMWADRMPRLVAASSKCVAHDAAFAFQMGDLVQGDCGNRDTHRRMLDDAFGLLKKSYGSLPVVVVPGNHDIRGDIEGDGAKETLEKWMPERMSRELGVEVAGTTFLFWHDPDAYIVVNFNKPDNPDFAQLMGLLKRSEGARHTFILSHGPVIPSCTSRWFLLGDKDRTEERRELRAALAKRGAIALSGHTHVLEHYECVFPEGRISQFVFNSVWSRPGAENLDLDGKGTHGYAMKALSKRNYTPPPKNPADVARWNDLAELADEYSPFVREGLAVSTVGHYRMNVSDDCVTVDFFAGDSTSPKRRFELLAGRRGGMI